MEIRCTLKAEGNFSGTAYSVRYFQYDGDGVLRLGRDGEPFMPNGRYPVEKGDFHLYYDSRSTEQHSLEIVFEDNFGQSQVLELDFNDKRDDDDPKKTGKQ